MQKLDACRVQNATVNVVYELWVQADNGTSCSYLYGIAVQAGMLVNKVRAQPGIGFFSAGLQLLEEMVSEVALDT